MNIIRPIGLAFFVGVLITKAAYVQAAPADIDGWSDSVVGTAIAQGTFPGAVVVVVRKGEPAFLKGYGVSSVVQRDPIDHQACYSHHRPAARRRRAAGFGSGRRQVPEALQAAATRSGKDDDS